MNEYFILEEDGNEIPVDLHTWALWFQHNDGRVLAHTDVAADVFVSTIFLGVDHGHGGERLMYETMTFGGSLTGKQSRYATRAEALAGHQRAVSSAMNVKPT